VLTGHRGEPVLLLYDATLNNPSLDEYYGVLLCMHNHRNVYTNKKTQIFLIYKEIQNGAVAESYMTNGLLICGEIFAHFLIC
jgi:hypothetical protein